MIYGSYRIDIAVAAGGLVVEQARSGRTAAGVTIRVQLPKHMADKLFIAVERL